MQFNKPKILYPVPRITRRQRLGLRFKQRAKILTSLDFWKRNKGPILPEYADGTVKRYKWTTGSLNSSTTRQSVAYDGVTKTGRQIKKIGSFGKDVPDSLICNNNNNEYLRMKRKQLTVVKRRMAGLGPDRD